MPPVTRIIKTFGEILPTEIIELVASGPSQLSFQLVLWDGKEASVWPTLRTESTSGFGVTVFEPPDIDSNILRGIRFPTPPRAYSSIGELFRLVAGLIQDYTALSEKLCRLLAYSVFASGLADCTPIPICISIVGPESRQSRQLFRVLSCLFRRPLPLSDVSLSELCSLPTGLFPSLFLEQRELSPQSEKVLYASRDRGSSILWKGRLVNLGWAKVIRTEEPLSNFKLGPGVIEIPVDPSPRSVPMLHPGTEQRIADWIQPMLLMYRLQHIRRIADSRVDFPDLAPPVREVACCLAQCMPDMPDVQSEMTSLLEEQNLQVQSEFETNPYSIVIEAMLSFCHNKTKSVRVAEVAAAVKAISEQDGEMLELTPKAAGGKLDLLGLRTKRLDARSRGLVLTEATRRFIHKLAWDYGVTKNRDIQRCNDCKHFAKLEKDRRKASPPGKGPQPPVQPQEDQPLVQPNTEQLPSVEPGQDFKAPRESGSKDDQDLVDKSKKESEP
jgi:hypothetical protein